ncbi:hypothetical protein M0R45_006250 [Rubus argutus]|uniref:UspA domain-containing protein n=1 Tax=Rubus argutus TaxID=59490 RepID=A0AAW1YPX6_RUBAR
MGKARTVEGDRIILIHVEQPRATKKQLFEDTGSRTLIPLEEFNVSKQYGLTNDPEVHDILDTASRTKGKLCDAVQDLKLDSLVVGSRGLGLLKRVLLGSVMSSSTTSKP